MNFRFTKVVIASIVIALLIAGGAYFGSRWLYRDLPGDTSKASTPPTIEKDSIVTRDDGGRVSAPNSSDQSKSDDASADLSVLSGDADRVTADLEQTRLQLKAWGDDYIKQFPDVLAVEVTVEGFQELLKRVSDQNQQLKEEGVPVEARIQQLTRFAAEISRDIAARNRTHEIHFQLLRENTELKVKIDRYLNNRTFLPLPPYLMGLNEKQLKSLEHLKH